MATDRAKEAAAREIYELKQQALVYYQENGVPDKMEEILNSTFYDNPVDVYGHIANFFEKFSQVPTISKVRACEALDASGGSSIQTEIHCTIKNYEKCVSTTVTPNEDFPPDSMKPEEKETAEEERVKFVNTAIEQINNDIAELLCGLEPTNQTEADSRVCEIYAKKAEEEAERLAKEAEEKQENEEETGTASPTKAESPSKKGKGSAKGKNKGPAVVIIPDEPRENFICGCNAISSVSKAVCQAGAQVLDIPLYQHIATCRFDEVPNTYKMPIPMVTILSSGKLAPGKLNGVKEFMVIPKPGMPLKDSFKYITKIYEHCAKNVSAKTGIVSRNVNELGALMPTYDRVEQGLDLLQEAMTQLELTPGEDFHIALNCAGHDGFDFDKGKYELAGGQQKLAEDLPDFFAELVGKYPSLIAIIDPMRKQDQESWMKLCEKVTEQCYVVGDYVYHRPGLLKEEEMADTFKTSAVVLKMEHMNSVGDVLSAAKKMEDADNQIILSTNVKDSPDNFIVDMAVGMQAKFIKLGAPMRGERVSKLNRLLQIENQLKEQDKLSSWDEHTFVLIKPPTPPPEETEEGEKPAGSPDSAKSKK